MGKHKRKKHFRVVIGGTVRTRQKHRTKPAAVKHAKDIRRRTPSTRKLSVMKMTPKGKGHTFKEVWKE